MCVTQRDPNREFEHIGQIDILVSFSKQQGKRLPMRQRNNSVNEEHNRTACAKCKRASFFARECSPMVIF